MFSRFCVSRQTLVSCWRFNQPEARNLGRNKHVRVAVQEGHEKSGSASLLHIECWKCGMSHTSSNVGADAVQARQVRAPAGYETVSDSRLPENGASATSRRTDRHDIVAEGGYAWLI